MTLYSNIPENPDPVKPESFAKVSTGNDKLALYNTGSDCVISDHWVDLGAME